MQIESLSPELIERCLDARGWRFYRGGDGKDFLVLFGAEHGTLQVNVRISGSRGDVLVVSVSPGVNYPAAERARLMELVNDWNRDTHWPKAFVRETSTPDKVGVVGENSYPVRDGIHVEALTDFIGRTVSCGADLFDKINDAISLPSAQTLEHWLDRTA